MPKTQDAEKKTLKADILKALSRLGIKEPQRVFDEFDLGTIPEESDELARPIAKKVNERIDAYVLMLEGFLQPDTSIAAMNEVGFFDEKELVAIVGSYRILMRTLRAYTEADLKATSEAYSGFITAALEAWEKERGGLLRIAKKLQQGWAKEQPLQREKGYFG
jgi:hypothetical protein